MGHPPWYQYVLPSDGADHPTLGWSAQSIVITNAFMEDQDGTGITTSYLISKQDVLAGRLTTYTWFRQHQEAHAVRGNASLSSNNAFVVEAGENLSGISIWRFQGVPPGQVEVKKAKVDVGDFGHGGPYVQGDSVYVPAAKVYDAVQRGDDQRVYVVVDDTPGASIRLFEFENLLGNWPPKLNSSTLFSDGPGAALYQASIDLDRDGVAWVGANCSAATLPLSICLGGRHDGDTSTHAMAVVKAGTEWWDGFEHHPGDFTTIVRDPGNPKFLYLTGQIGLPHGLWGTWIMQVGSTCTLTPKRQCT